MTIPFTKVQSIGNDFVLVDLGCFPKQSDLDRNPSESHLIEFMIKACARRFGVGSDGLLGVQREGDGLRVRMFNPDGTEDFCGNGLRCAAHWAYRHRWVGKEFVAMHLGREVAVRIDPEEMLIKTQIGLACFDPKSIPLAPGTGELFESKVDVKGEVVILSAVSTGTAHTIIFVDALPDDEKFLRLSPALEHHALFPERTSVIWTRIVDTRQLELRIWERGVGETMGCGTGTTAAAATYMRKARQSGTILVKNPGGMLQVSAPSWDAPLWLEGKAQMVYEGQFCS
jgi:diaminopimelate epimerase